MMMTGEPRLLCVLAHPDDESLGVGGILAKYAAEGAGTYLVTATRGERGRFGESRESPGPEVVGKVREGELRAAAKELGLREVHFLDYCDGELDRADPREAIGKIAAHIRRIEPQVVVTFGPDGAYGHPDHIAISQLAGAAAAEAGGVRKFYYMAWSRDQWAAYLAAFKSLKVNVDGIERQAVPWPDWAITTVIDTRDVWAAVWRAVLCHRTQMAIHRQLEQLSEEEHRKLWGCQQFYRVFSHVNGGRKREEDLFEGLR
ncbi:MAG: PIG-L family deacetylase [Bryobacterales bacterium]|nr:PIG-L family deacetylase [Bryobacterales bacterium]